MMINKQTLTLLKTIAYAFAPLIIDENRFFQRDMAVDTSDH